MTSEKWYLSSDLRKGKEPATQAGQGVCSERDSPGGEMLWQVGGTKRPIGLELNEAERRRCG